MYASAASAVVRLLYVYSGMQPCHANTLVDHHEEAFLRQLDGVSVSHRHTDEVGKITDFSTNDLVLDYI